MSHGTVCLTDDQTKGRGQYERTWETQPARNLTFSIAFQPKLQGRLHILTLMCAYCLVQLLDELYDLEAIIKWPNDVLVDGRKIAGFLTESVFVGDTLERVVVGIGLNVNQRDFSPELARQANSLVNLTGYQLINREKLLSRFLDNIETHYTNWHKQSTDLLASINKNIDGYGKWITLEINDEVLPDSYKLLGVNEHGQLTVLDQELNPHRYEYEQIRIITD